jgi:glycosyltransferase involved in cell wall biosynthesis
MRSAIVHYWLVNMRGGEKVLESMCRLLPDADIFTIFYDPEKVSPLIRSRNVKASFLNPFKRFYRSLLPVMPYALEHFDLRGYDLVVSSESGPAKGVLTASVTRHICYCHTPMRYLWDLYPAYLHDWTTSRFKQAVVTASTKSLRVWDYAAAGRVDEFIANSCAVQKRIWKAYRRESRVIHPPVAVESFYWRPAEDYYLVVSELVAYKCVADAVRCFTRTGRNLKIVGGGPEYSDLKRMAGRSVEFCGRVSDSELRRLFSGCRALVQTGEEDFGIVAVEAMASGKPVVALGRGGILDIVRPDDAQAGVLYEQPGDEALQQAVTRFELLESFVNPDSLQARASRFSEARFLSEMHQVIQSTENVKVEQALVSRGATN